MSTYTQSLGLEEITPGDQAGLWGNTTNNNLALIDQAITGVTPITEFTGVSGTTKTLDAANGALDEARAAVLNITGTATGPNTVIVPNKQKTYLVRNDTGQNITFRTASSGATVLVAAGYSIPVFCDGNNNVYTGFETPTAGTLTVPFGGTGVTAFTAGFVKSPGGAGDLTSVSAIDLNSSDTTNTLPVTKGGTGLGTLTAGAILRGAGTSSPALISGPAGVPGQVLTWNGSQWEGQNPASGGITSISAGTGISVNGGSGPVTSGAVTIANTNTTNTVNPTFSTSVTTPIYYVGNTSNYITQSSNEIAFIAGGLQTAKVTNAGIGANAVGCTSSNAGGQVITVAGVGPAAGYNSGMAPASVQCGAGGFGLTYTPGTPRLDILGGSLSAYFSGSFGVQGNNSPNWTTISDQNLKTNFRPISSALNKLSALNPCHFEYKDELGKTRSGFIAQEFETVFPGHVTETGVADNYKQFLPEGQEKIKALDLNLLPYLVKAIQELKAELDEAKAEIAALKVK